MSSLAAAPSTTPITLEPHICIVKSSGFRVLFDSGDSSIPVIISRFTQNHNFINSSLTSAGVMMPFSVISAVMRCGGTISIISVSSVLVFLLAAAFAANALGSCVSGS